MLTRDQIQRLAQRHAISAQAQERDYLQHVLLFLLYTRTQELVFKGGTALRIAYRGNRYSEDLDFNGAADQAANREIWLGVVEALGNFGMAGELRSEWTSPVGYSFGVSYRGPLYDGRDRSKGKIRVDINLRPEVVETQAVLARAEYDDVRPFVLTVLTAEHILAEKMRALLMRAKPRDAYDIWLLSSQGVRAAPELVQSKLQVLERAYSRQDLEAALEQARGAWERDLRPLLAQFVAWEVVEGTVVDQFREIYFSS
jgi:predicted nucleotidyltransferase component of viral defense system